MNKKIRLSSDSASRKELLDAESELIEFQDANAQALSPTLSVELKRKFKKIELIQNVVILLEKQLELLKIEEVRERPVVNILDKPDIYDKPIKPQKRRIVTVNTFISFLVAFASTILYEKAKKYQIVNEIKREIKIRI